MGTGGYVTLTLMIGLILVAIVGAVIETTKIGDIPNLDYERLKQEKFENASTHDRRILARKKEWTTPILAFSYIRNFLQVA